LYLGGGRVFYEYIPAGGIGAKELLSVIQPFQKKNLATSNNPLGNDSADQLLSLFARWVFASIGLELFGEWGRNDHSWDARDFFLEPNHAAASLLGMRKTGSLGDGIVRVHGELISLPRRRGSNRGWPPWYAHHFVSQGYTQEGQGIGSALGPDSNAGLLAIEWQTNARTFGTLVRRREHDRDNVAFDGGLFAKWQTSTGFRVHAAIQHTVESNRYSVAGSGSGNFLVALRAEWSP
jgi:hypothetical protein